MELLARIELATSSLPRKCSTPELQEQMALLKMERVAGIEPAPSAWKAEVLPLNYTRRVVYLGREYGGGGRIRTFEAFATELQSVGFDRSPTPPSEQVCLLMVC